MNNAEKPKLHLQNVSNSFVFVLVAEGLNEPIGIYTTYNKAYRKMKKLNFKNSEIQRWRLD